MVAPQLEAGDQQPAGLEVPRDVREHSAFGARREEDHHVPGRDDHIEGPIEVERREVGLDPGQLGRSAAGGGEHVRVEVDADDIDPATGELPRDAARAAPGVERRRRLEAHDEVHLAVHVLAGGRARVVARVVRLAGQVLRAEPPILGVGHRVLSLHRDRAGALRPDRTPKQPHDLRRRRPGEGLRGRR